ncbi:diguanylate cyclase (GGDEF)-like protein [Actinoplanes lutulentus]|uniref:Diguanylate cyclase (GGDEF)-like protein n=1 Tax=Actinoplanes lutulentus TaxID=1287878 RepID=A0A327YX10_9ACTN|nr:GGDEF domain-containing protein [Actinoplanes lutulentus]MBB2947498.1 diguanylate cyclase (GGDEF)-like protein [Actinoplanes lutulentus]RAK25654.1 diguanylate cyclase (GGDEF)-like protein [Actinoplanes lutulentus]
MTGRTFGILSPFVGGDYYGAIIAGINAAAVAGGDRVMAVQTLDPGSHSADRSGLPDFDRPLAWDHLAGLALLPGAVADSYAEKARQAGLPVVQVAQDGCGSAVLADNRSGVRDAVAHLIEHGHSRIGFAGYLAHYDLRERHEGYREAMLEHGLDPVLFESADNHESGGETVAEDLIRAGMPVTAIVVGTDRNAIGLISRLSSAGRMIAVVGFDDIADAAYLKPALSTVRQPLDAVGSAAYDRLSHFISGQVERVPTVFVPRESCGCPSQGFPIAESHTRGLFSEVQYLQSTLNIQYELGIALLGADAEDPRSVEWLSLTPAVAGCLGLWSPGDSSLLQLVGEYRTSVGAPDAEVPVAQFPPPELFGAADGEAGDVVMVAPVRSRARDWGMLAAVGRIQSTTPPGREMMNHSGSLLGKALDYQVTMAALREQEERLRTAALRDHLTGLPNRLLLEDRLTQAGLRATRDPEYRFAVLLLDLDGFKAVNDTLGHAAGDQLLIKVAKRLTKLLRRTDTVARLGGDEFVVLVGGVSAEDGHETVRKAIQTALSEPYLIDDKPVTVGVSIGVAVSGDTSADPDRLLREADAAMYREKTARR